LDKVLFEIVCSDELLAQIEEHCFSQTRTEVGGFLVGEMVDGKSVVTHVIKAKHTAAQMTQLTFTHKTWDAALAEMAKIKPDAQFIGWYHSHPNFGIFLSDQDKFIQTQFFSTDGSVTIVVDPIRGKRGWFISRDKEVVPHGKEEDTTREKLGESSSDPDENIPAIAAKQSTGGIGVGRVLAICAIFSLLSMFGGFTLANSSNNSSDRIANLERDLSAVIGILQENGLVPPAIQPEVVAPTDPTAPVAPAAESPAANPSAKATASTNPQPERTLKPVDTKKTLTCYSKTGGAQKKITAVNPNCPKGFTAVKPTILKPAAEKPAAEKPAAEKPAAEKPAAEKPAAEKPAAEKPADAPVGPVTP
jgi:proteasome lid subunit RPN8/RPN11